MVRGLHGADASTHRHARTPASAEAGSRRDSLHSASSLADAPTLPLSFLRARRLHDVVRSQWPANNPRGRLTICGPMTPAMTFLDHSYSSNRSATFALYADRARHVWQTPRVNFSDRSTPTGSEMPVMDDDAVTDSSTPRCRSTTRGWLALSIESTIASTRARRSFSVLRRRDEARAEGPTRGRCAR